MRWSGVRREVLGLPRIALGTLFALASVSALACMSDAADDAGETGSPWPAWLDAIEGDACPDALEDASACLRLGERSYHLPTGTGDFRTVSFGSRVELEYRSSAEASALVVTLSYPAELTNAIDCESEGASIRVTAGEDFLTSAPFGVPGPCSMMVPATAAEVGASVFGSIETEVEEERGAGPFALDFQWSATVLE